MHFFNIKNQNEEQVPIILDPNIDLRSIHRVRPERQQDDNSARVKEKYYYKNMVAQGSTNDGYIIDGEWMEKWIQFITKAYMVIKIQEEET